MTVYKYRFDFEIGYLVKSPCKECDRKRDEFPDCIDSCELIDRIHGLLAETRSSSRSGR